MIYREKQYNDTLCHFNSNHDPRTGQFTSGQVGAIVNAVNSSRKRGSMYKTWDDVHKKNYAIVGSNINDKKLKDLTKKSDAAYKKYIKMRDKLWDADAEANDLEASGAPSDRKELARLDSKTTTARKKFEKIDKDRHKRANELVDGILKASGITDRGFEDALRTMVLISADLENE